MPQSTFLVRRIHTGNVIVFDKKNRELFVINEESAALFDETLTEPLTTAKTLVAEGKAQRFDKAALETLNAALGGILLLG